jgi:hypothetical protein
MSKKSLASLKIAPLQRVIAEPITDPAEQAALDRVRKRLKGRKRNRNDEPDRDRVLLKDDDPEPGKTLAKCVKKEHYDVVLADDPGSGLLSKDVVAKLREVLERYQDMDEWEMVEASHNLEEWRKNFPAGNIPLMGLASSFFVHQHQGHFVLEFEIFHF